MPTYKHNDYYGYINQIQEKGISNPSWFWGNTPDASEARQWLYNNGASAIVDDIYKNTPEEIQRTIPANYLSQDLQKNRYMNDVHNRNEEAGKTVAKVAAGVAGAPSLIGASAAAPIATGLSLIGGVVGGIEGSKIGSEIGNNIYSRNTEGDGIGASISTNREKGATIGGLVGGLIGGISGSTYGKGVDRAINTGINTYKYYRSIGQNRLISTKLGISNGIWDLPLHKAVNESKLGKIGWYYLLRANRGDSHGTFKRYVYDDGEWGITASNLKDNYKLGLFRNDKTLSKIFNIDKVKYPKLTSSDAITANEQIGSLINQSIPENIPGKPAVNNTNADIYGLKVDNPKYVYRKRPTYRTRKSPQGWASSGEGSGHRSFEIGVNADLGGHWEKGITGEPIQIYDWNHFTPLPYAKKWNVKSLIQLHGLTGLNRVWKPFAFYGKTINPTEFYLKPKLTSANINMDPYTNEL